MSISLPQQGMYHKCCFKPIDGIQAMQFVIMRYGSITIRQQLQHTLQHILTLTLNVTLNLTITVCKASAVPTPNHARVTLLHVTMAE